MLKIGSSKFHLILVKTVPTDWRDFSEENEPKHDTNRTTFRNNRYKYTG